MLESGEIIDVEVQSVATFGLFCSYKDQEVLVLIPEISWIASFCSCEQFAQSGDQLTVKIKHVDNDSGKVAASIKGLHPNPWETDQLKPGAKHTARVVRHVAVADRCDDKPGYLIEVVPGAFALLAANIAMLEPDQECPVTITKSNPTNHSVEIALAGQSR